MDRDRRNIRRPSQTPSRRARLNISSIQRIRQDNSRRSNLDDSNIQQRKTYIGDTLRNKEGVKRPPTTIDDAWGSSESDNSPVSGNEDNNSYGGNFMDDTVDRIGRIYSYLLQLKHSVVSKISGIFSSSGQFNTMNNNINNLINIVVKKTNRVKFKGVKLNSKLGAGTVSGILIVGVITTIMLMRNSTEFSTSDQLGASTNTSTEAGSSGSTTPLPTVIDNFDIDVIYPVGKDSSDFKVVDISPSGNDSVYAYVDSLDGVDIKISQQSLPASFKDGTDTVKDLAEGFQAISIIQVDSTTVYHGYSDNGGGVQSIVLTKNDILIFISSPKKISDDKWAFYISALK